MEVTKKVSESMNMFSGGSNGQNIKLAQGDQQIEPFGLNAKIEKESEWKEGESMWRDFITSKKSTWTHHCAIDD